MFFNSVVTITDCKNQIVCLVILFAVHFMIFGNVMT